MVVTTIGNHDHCLSSVARVLQFLHAQIHAVPQCGEAVRLNRIRRPVDLGCGVIQVESNTRLILYDDQAEVILRIRAVDELRERLPRFLDLDRHTGTRIENHNQ